MNPQPKTKNIRNYAYREFLEKKPCCICHSAKGLPTCAAHYRTGTDGGTSQKPSDTFCVPLCFGVGGCHEEQHAMGETEFWKYHGVNPFEIMVKSLTEYWKLHEDKMRPVRRDRKNSAL